MQEIPDAIRSGAGGDDTATPSLLEPTRSAHVLRAAPRPPVTPDQL